MKDYLSREERRIATFICICFGLIETVLDYGDNISKDEIKNLKYSRTYLGKYINALIKRVGGEEGGRIYRDAQNNKVDLVPKTYDGQFIVDKESLEGALTYAVEGHCDKCKHGRDYYNTCELYKCMNKLGMGSTSKREDVCEFNMNY